MTTCEKPIWDGKDLVSNENATEQHQDTIQSVVRALRVLQAFSSKQPELGVAELSRLTGLHKTTVYRLLVTLEQERFVQHSPDKDKYKLGPALIRLGRVVLDSTDLAKLALPHLHTLADETDETVMLEIWDNDRTLVVACVEGRHLSRVSTRTGSRMPAHASSSGKLLLAFLPREEVDKVIVRELKRYTENTITDQGSLLVELAKIRANGIAFDREELDIGTCAISVPIFDHRDKLAGALTVAGPTQRLSFAEDGGLTHVMQRIAVSISGCLGYTPVDH